MEAEKNFSPLPFSTQLQDVTIIIKMTKNAKPK
jgi:hypothetical protein